MKVSVADVAPMSTNVKCEVTTASIEMGAFAFQALSGKNLYKNLIKAIVRELATNAIDSHIAAGKPESPIFVHLPTKEEPWFSVRDEGVGLDDAGTRHTYLTFFGSTKRNDINQIGAWGLGTKSPLGYSDNFTVTAIKDGVQRMYVVFIGEDGCPSITMLAEMPTKECNGLEVKVPITTSYDFSTFIDEAANVYQWFPIKPILNMEIEYPDQRVWSKDIIAGVDLTGRSSINVIHGMICYPVELHLLTKLHNDVRSMFRNAGINIYAPNGAVDYSMSREELSYKDSTIDYLCGKLTDLANALKTNFIAEMQDLSNWDKYLYAKNIKSCYKHISDEIIKEGHSPLHTADGVAMRQSVVFYKGIYPRSIKIVGKKGNVKVGNYNADIIDPHTELKILVNDQDLSDGRMTKKLNYNNYGMCVKDDHELIEVIHSSHIKDVVERYMEVFGHCPPMSYVSEMTDVPKKPRQKRESGYVADKSAYCRRFKSDEKFTSQSYLLSSFTAPFFYVAMANHEPVGITKGQLRRVKLNLGLEVFGVPPKHLKEVQSNQFAVNIIDELKGRINVIENNFKVDGVKVRFPSWITGRIRETMMELDDLSMYSNDSILNIEHHDDLCRMIGIFDSPVQKEMVAARDAINDHTEMLKRKYKLVSMINGLHYEGNDVINEAASYIRFKNTMGEMV